jgi:hypothetical protein
MLAACAGARGRGVLRLDVGEPPRMIRRSLFLLTFALFAFVLTGCGPRWVVVAQAAPNPFVGQGRFAVLPVDFAGLEIGAKPEAIYLSEKSQEQRDSFMSDKAALNEAYTGALISQARALGVDVVLATGPNDAPFQIRPSVAWLEPGWFGGIVSAPSQVKMAVKIVLPDGRVLDEIRMMHATGASFITAASGTRLRGDGQGLGVMTSQYLKTRVQPKN